MSDSSATILGSDDGTTTAGAYSAGWAEGVRKGAAIACSMKPTPVRPKVVANEILKVLEGMK